MSLWNLVVRWLQVFPTPLQEQTFGQRLVRGLIFFGLLPIAWKVAHSGPAPTGWRLLLGVVLVGPATITAVIFASAEHFVYRRLKAKDDPLGKRGHP